MAAKKFLVRKRDGKTKLVRSFKVKRFPRLRKGEKLAVSRTGKFALRVKSGEIPRGYDYLDKKWKKLAKRVAAGLSVKDACKEFGVDTDTFYRRRTAHKLFREYLYKCYKKAALAVDERLAAQSVRATSIVSEAMENDDPYFRYEVAKEHLRGMGRYASRVKSESHSDIDVGGSVEITGQIGEQGVLNKELAQMFVKGLIQMSVGKSMPIDIPVREVKELPSGDTKVQESQQG